MGTEVKLPEDEVKVLSRFDMTLMRKGVDPEKMKSIPLKLAAERLVHVLQRECTSGQPVKMFALTESANGTFKLLIVRKGGADPVKEGLKPEEALNHLVTVITKTGAWGGPYRGYTLNPATPVVPSPGPAPAAPKA